MASHLGFARNVQPGDRVWAPWNAGVLFVGTVEEIGHSEAHICFDDGDRGWVQLDQLLPLEIPVGLRVAARWKMGSTYFPGTVADVRDERIHIHYDDGDKEWTRPAALALPCQPFGPDARPTKTVTHGSPNLGWLVWVGIAVLLAVLRAGCR